MSEVVGKNGSAKRIRHITTFPDDLMHVIFSKLEFLDKIKAGIVCKQWDQLLKAGTDNARHWVVDYNVDTLVSRLGPTRDPYQAELSVNLIQRYVTVHTQSPMCFMQICLAQEKLHSLRLTASYLLFFPFHMPVRPFVVSRLERN
jgi:hypothetical protein